MYITVLTLIIVLILMYYILNLRYEHYGAIIDSGMETKAGTYGSRNMLEYSKVDRETGFTHILLSIDFDNKVNLYDTEESIDAKFKIDPRIAQWIHKRMRELEFINIKHNSGDIEYSNTPLKKTKLVETLYYNDGNKYSNTVADHIILPNGLNIFVQNLLQNLRSNYRR